VLADLNSLDPNASVFPGQQLVIPADLVETDYDKALSDTQQAASLSKINTQDLSNPVENTAINAKNNAQSVNSETKESGESVAVQDQDEQQSGKPFKLNPGETLWDFAKRTTGDATNWQAIAGQNNFSDRQAVVVRAGQTIFVPEGLVRPELNSSQSVKQTAKTVTAPSTATTVADVASVAENTDADAIDASTELLAGAAALMDETQPIKIVEATFKSDASIQPIALEKPAEPMASVDKSAGAPTQIMVSGTYYPKAVYNDADFSSSLLMRVSPGTTLQVSKAMGNWFQVETERGVGYVHQRDIK
jgi:LysM repeat protein